MSVLLTKPVAGPLLTHGDLPISHWTGTATEPLKTLAGIAGYADKRPPKGWPGAPHMLTGTLKRIAPALLAQGLVVGQLSRDDKKGTKLWRVRYEEGGKCQKIEGGCESAVQDNAGASDASPSYPLALAPRASEVTGKRQRKRFVWGTLLCRPTLLTLYILAPLSGNGVTTDDASGPSRAPCRRRAHRQRDA